MIPSTWGSWLATSFACAMSTLLVVRELRPLIREHAPVQARAMLVALVVLAQLVYFVVVKLSFFGF